jgi:hypothetical protein
MGKLEPIERVIKAPERAQILRCTICGKPLDQKDRWALVHAACKGARATKD